MLRVGLYLALPPSAGGAYQYTLTMLEGLAALPRDRYSPLAVCARPGWREIVQTLPIEHCDLVPPALSSLAAFAWRKGGLPIDVWRAIAPAIDPQLRRLRRLKIDLLICPG